MRTRWLLSGIVLFTAPALVLNSQSLPRPHADTPAAKNSAGAYNWFGRAGLVCGGGASLAAPNVTPTMQCGGIFGGPLFDIEAGVMGPQAKHSSVSGYLSTNLWFPLVPRLVGNKRGFPLAVGGYTRMFETGSAVDYGFAYAYPIDDSHSIQFEARDYWIVKDPQQHNVIFRVAWLVGLPD